MRALISFIILNFRQTFQSFYIKILFFHLYLLCTSNLLITFLHFYRQEILDVACNVEMIRFCDAAGKGIQTYEFVFQNQGLV